jgi:hypothetical protein
MKQKTKLGSQATVAANLTIARRLLAEMSYFIFTPGEHYLTSPGFIAIRAKAVLHPEVIHVHSRGSFLQTTFSSLLFSGYIVKRIRKNLYVPLHIRPTELPSREELHMHINEAEHAELTQLLADARLS